MPIFLDYKQQSWLEANFWFHCDITKIWAEGLEPSLAHQLPVLPSAGPSPAEDGVNKLLRKIHLTSSVLFPRHRDNSHLKGTYQYVQDLSFLCSISGNKWKGNSRKQKVRVLKCVMSSFFHSCLSQICWTLSWPGNFS